MIEQKPELMINQVTKAEVCFRVIWNLSAFMTALRRFTGLCCSTYLCTSIENIWRWCACCGEQWERTSVSQEVDPEPFTFHVTSTIITLADEVGVWELPRNLLSSRLLCHAEMCKLPAATEATSLLSLSGVPQYLHTAHDSNHQGRDTYM